MQKDIVSEQSKAYGVLVQQLEVATSLSIQITPTLWTVILNLSYNWGTITMFRLKVNMFRNAWLVKPTSSKDGSSQQSKPKH
ncbi:hypothetical protein SLEP1_g24062 [Rubroshorea leprosula]|uniref:ATP synthase F0 subunit 8 n=1 Tax=Rubroshorea leprosula TaxID=152421 RepID=A0AAV5JLN6_9ROSI|nr:hypothetical protein SLEP1_g24062 [Rubroshorea leprosula]